MALGCSTIDEDCNRELYIIGIVKMKGPHTAENVLIAIQEILAQMQFNKAKITAIVCDEGSNLLRLFKAIDSQNNFYLNYLEDDIDNPADLDYQPVDTDESTDEDSSDEVDDEDNAGLY